MKNDGGSAFPVLHTIDGNWVKEPLKENRGMSLRDYFAAKAMAAYMATDYESCCRDSGKLARWAYENADAMLAERTK